MNQRPPMGRTATLAFRVFGTVMVALGAAGAVLPGLPTTPFLLLAVWAFGRSNPELAERLERHPRYGPMLVNWRTRRAVPRRAKIFAIGSMAASWALLWYGGAPPLGLLAVGVILASVSAYLVSRPSA